jgi:hypothetical protein
MDAIRVETTLAAWQLKSWTTLRDAAYSAYQAKVARLRANATSCGCC